MTRRTYGDDPDDGPYEGWLDDPDDPDADDARDVPGASRVPSDDEEDVQRPGRRGAWLRELVVRLVAGRFGRPAGSGDENGDGDGEEDRTGGRRGPRRRHLVPRFDPEIGFVGEPADLGVPWRYTVPRWLLAALVLLAAVALVVVLARLDPVGSMIAALPWWLWPWG